MRPGGQTLVFMRALWELTHALQVSSKRMARTLGVTGPQRLVIRVVGQTPGITPRDLAQELGLHPSTLTGVLDRLVRQGFVRRRVDPADRRRARLDLTASGKKVDREKRGTVEAAVRRAIAHADVQTIAKTERMLALVVAELARDGADEIVD
jgi:DNA-binding MarR family transcriptional regulator